MKHFIALVHKEKDSAYGVTFPDLPNVFSAADEEAPMSLSKKACWMPSTRQRANAA